MWDLPAPSSSISGLGAPATFAERGAAVPFTTPLLAAARVRAGRGGAIELIVPDRALARGDCVLPWGAVRELCRPTVHDWRLHQAIARAVMEEATAAPTPLLVRRAATSVAAQGFAGRAARGAAQRAAAAQAARARACAAAMGSAPPRLLAMAAALGPNGELAALEAELAGFARRAAAADAVTMALAALAEAALATIGTARLRAREALADPARLLRNHRNAPADTEKILSAPDWLLDGWGPAAAAGGAGSLRDAATLAPILPREVEGWPGAQTLPALAARLRRALATTQAVAGTAPVMPVADRIARNERARAEALSRLAA